MDYPSCLKKIEYFKDRDLSYSFDSLTKVLDRQTMIDYITYLTDSGSKFSLFLVDIDNFKNVNDTYGHLVGDVVLSETANYLVKKSVGKGVVARYGGDEFMIVFDKIVEYEEVWKYGHEIDLNIGSLAFPGMPNFGVTVSMGIARSPLNASGYEELLTVADKALYRAKMKGRNCFIIYLPEKHANISLQKDREKKLTSMNLVFNVYSSLTANGEDIGEAINTLFRCLVSHFMYDHICIEARNDMNFSVSYALSKKFDFTHIDFDLINSHINPIGYISLNYVSLLNMNAFQELAKEFKKQEISSTLYCKISAYGKDYGFIRIDTVSTARIWQNSEIAIIMAAANSLGLMLHYQNKTLEELPHVEHSTVGGEE